MKKRINECMRSSVEALDACSFAKSRDLADEALNLCDTNSVDPPKQLFLVSGKAASGLGDHARAVVHFEKAAALDEKWMAPLVGLSETFSALGDQNQLAKVRKQQAAVALENGKREKSLEFELLGAKAIEASGADPHGVIEAYAKVFYTSEKDEECTQVCDSASQAVLRLVLGKEVRDEFLELASKCAIRYVEYHLRAGQGTTSLALTPSQACSQVATLLLRARSDSIGDFLDKLCEVCKTRPGDDVEGSKCWVLSRNILMLGNEGGPLSDKTLDAAVQILTNCSDDEDCWRAWSIVSWAFRQCGALGAARRCSDLAVLALKESRTKLLEIRETLTQMKDLKQSARGFCFGTKQEGEKEPGVQNRDPKLYDAFYDALASVSARLWMERADMFMRCYIQGSGGRISDANSSERYAKEGLSCLEKLENIVFVTDVKDMKLQLQYLCIESASVSTPQKGLAKTICELADQLAGHENGTQREQLSLGAWYASKAFCKNGDSACQNLADYFLELASNGQDEILCRHASAAYATSLMQRHQSSGEKVQELVQKCTNPGTADESLIARARELASRLKGRLVSVPISSIVLPAFILVQGLAALEAGDKARAHPLLLKAVQLDPGLGAGFAALGEMYLEQNVAEKGRRCVEKAFQLDPGSADRLERLASLYIRLGEKQGAQKCYQKTISVVQRLHMSGNTHSGFAAAEQAAWLGLGRLSLVGSDFPKAATSFQKVVVADRDSDGAWLGLGDAYLGMGRVTAALRAFDTAVLATDQKQGSKAYALLRQGRTLCMVGQPKEACAALARAAQLAPESSVVAWTLAYAQFAEAKSLEKAARFQAAHERASEALRSLEKMASALSSFRCADQLAGQILSFLESISNARAIPKASDGAARRRLARQIYREPWELSNWANATRHCARQAQQHQNAGHEHALLAKQLGQCCIALDPVAPVGWELLGAACILCSLSSSSAPCWDLAQHSLVRCTQLDGGYQAWSNIAAMLEWFSADESARQVLVNAASAKGLAGDAAAAIWAARARLSLRDDGDSAALCYTKAASAFGCAIDASGDCVRSPAARQACTEYAELAIFSKINDRGQDWGRIAQVLSRAVERGYTDCDALSHYMFGLALRGIGNTGAGRLAFRDAFAGGVAEAAVNLVEAGDIEMVEPAVGALGTVPVAHALLSAGHPDQALQVIGRDDGAESLERELCLYRAQPTLEAAKAYADLAEKKGETCDPLGLAALLLGKENHVAEVALPRIRDAALYARIVSKIRCDARNGISVLRARARAVHLAPWASDLWVNLAEQSSGISVSFNPSQGAKEGAENAISAARAAIQVDQFDEQKDARMRADIVMCSARYITNDPTQSLAAKLWHRFPDNTRAMRLVAYASLADGAKERNLDKLLSCSAIFTLLIAKDDELDDVAGLCQASVEIVSASKRGDDEKKGERARAAMENIERLLERAATASNHSSRSDMVILGNVSLARLHIAVDKLEDGCHAFLAALQESPGSPLLWIELGNAVFVSDPSVASYCFESAATALGEQGQGRQLLECAARAQYALSVAKSVGVSKCLGGVNQIAKLWALDPRVHLLRGWLCLLLEDTKNKKNTDASFKRAIELDPRLDACIERIRTVYV